MYPLIALLAATFLGITGNGLLQKAAVSAGQINNLTESSDKFYLAEGMALKALWKAQADIAGPSTTNSTRVLGGLGISTDSGATFPTIKYRENGLPGARIYAVTASGNNIYVGGGYGIGISNNGGSSFTTKTTSNGLGNNRINQIFINGGSLLVATEGGLSTSTDGGNTFTNRAFATTANPPVSCPAKSVAANGAIILVATPCGVFQSTNSGSTYTLKTLLNGTTVLNVSWISMSGSLVAASTNSGLFISTDNGTTYSRKTAASNGIGHDSAYVTFVNGTSVWVGTYAGIARSTNSGSSFTNNTTVAIPRSLTASGSIVYASNDVGIYKSTDAGATFTKQTFTFPSGRIAAIAIDGTKMYLGYHAYALGALYGNANGTASWGMASVSTSGVALPENASGSSTSTVNQSSASYVTDSAFLASANYASQANVVSSNYSLTDANVCAQSSGSYLCKGVNVAGAMGFNANLPKERSRKVPTLSGYVTDPVRDGNGKVSGQQTLCGKITQASSQTEWKNCLETLFQSAAPPNSCSSCIYHYAKAETFQAPLGKKEIYVANCGTASMGGNSSCAGGNTFNLGLTISYTGVGNPSGYIRSIGSGETWTIKAMNGATTLETKTITGGSPGTGIGVLTPWSFYRAAKDITFVTITSTYSVNCASYMTYSVMSDTDVDYCTNPLQ